MRDRNLCHNSHPHMALNCVRGQHSFRTPCVAPDADLNAHGHTWTGQTVFVIAEGSAVRGVLTDRAEAEMFCNRSNMHLKRTVTNHPWPETTWRMHAMVVDGPITALLEGVTK